MSAGGRAGRAGAGVRRRRGFSVVEMMIVVVIIMVLATVAAPTFFGVHATDALVKATGQVQSAFELARTRAILKNAAVRIVVNRDASGVTPNIRVDEGAYSGCNAWDLMAGRTDARRNIDEALPAQPCTAWIPSERHRCGVAEVHITGDLAWGGYRERGIGLTSVTSGGMETPLATFCVNRRGRLLQWGGADWVPVVTGISVTLDRRHEGVWLGLNKRIWIPQGGVSGVFR